MTDHYDEVTQRDLRHTDYISVDVWPMDESAADRGSLRLGHFSGPEMDLVQNVLDEQDVDGVTISMFRLGYGRVDIMVDHETIRVVRCEDPGDAETTQLEFQLWRD